jgi:hypothetical protein
MEVFRPGKSLADQFGANGDSVLLDQTAIRLAVEKHLGQAGDQQRVGQAREDRQHNRGAYCDFDLVHFPLLTPG